MFIRRGIYWIVQYWQRSSVVKEFPREIGAQDDINGSFGNNQAVITLPKDPVSHSKSKMDVKFHWQPDQIQRHSTQEAGDVQQRGFSLGGIETLWTSTI